MVINEVSLWRACPFTVKFLNIFLTIPGHPIRPTTPLKALPIVTACVGGTSGFDNGSLGSASEPCLKIFNLDLTVLKLVRRGDGAFSGNCGYTDGWNLEGISKNVMEIRIYDSK